MSSLFFVHKNAFRCLWGRFLFEKRVILSLEVIKMDQIKTGKFIATLRKEKELTQEQLGEKLGVTNKTISRWENDNYMTDIEMLSLLSKEFDVSINELISGERLLLDDFKKAADNNLVMALNNSAFTLKEKIAFSKRSGCVNISQLSSYALLYGLVLCYG